jgi:hypothetical protein
MQLRSDILALLNLGTVVEFVEKVVALNGARKGIGFAQAGEN